MTFKELLACKINKKICYLGLHCDSYWSVWTHFWILKVVVTVLIWVTLRIFRVNVISLRSRMQRRVWRIRSVGWCWTNRSWSGRRYDWASRQRPPVKLTLLFFLLVSARASGKPSASNWNGGKAARRVARRREEAGARSPSPIWDLKCRQKT